MSGVAAAAGNAELIHQLAPTSAEHLMNVRWHRWGARNQRRNVPRRALMRVVAFALGIGLLWLAMRPVTFLWMALVASGVLLFVTGSRLWPSDDLDLGFVSERWLIEHRAASARDGWR